jgi:prepilin-type N-terminal cleavage/methylation domain-containing protein
MIATIKHARRAFSLIEMLMVIAIISVMTGLAISQFTDASQDSRTVMARQQQAAIQSAVMSWVSQTSNTSDRTISVVRDEYNLKAGTPRTDMERLALIQEYLDPGTFDHFVAYSSASQLRSAAMKKLNKYLVLSLWGDTGGYPRVELKP